MISIMLMIQNDREAKVLDMAFTQRGLKVILSKPNYQNYVKSLQYQPDLYMVEFPSICSEEIHFTRLIRKHRRTNKIPIIGYGSRVDEMIKNGLLSNGVSLYIERPLKFSSLLVTVEKLLKPFNKKIDYKESTLDEKEKDMLALLSSGESRTNKLQIMSKYISSLVAFPFTVARVLHITQDNSAGANHLAQAITADPSITAHILKVANSVFFASANRRIDSIKDAIVRIGFAETKRIAMCMSIMKLFDKETKTSGFDRVDFWYHSLATAVVAGKIAKYVGNVNHEIAFLSGLLHDFGLLLLDQYFPSILDKAIEETTQHAGYFPECSSSVLNFHQFDLIGELFPVWKLPHNLTDAIVAPYVSITKESFRDSVDQKLHFCIAIGNNLAKILHIGRECDEFVFPIHNKVFEYLKMRMGFQENFISDVNHEIQLYRTFLQLEEREYPSEYATLSSTGSLTVGLHNLSQDFFIPIFPYLKKGGYKVVTYPSQGIGAYNGCLDVLIIWISSATTFADLEPFTKLEKKAKDNEVLKEKVPLLLIIPFENQIEKLCPATISIMYNCFDMRTIDTAIEKILSGERVTIPQDPNCVAKMRQLMELEDKSEEKSEPVKKSEEEKPQENDKKANKPT